MAVDTSLAGSLKEELEDLLLDKERGIFGLQVTAWVEGEASERSGGVLMPVYPPRSHSVGFVSSNGLPPQYAEFSRRMRPRQERGRARTEQESRRRRVRD